MRRPTILFTLLKYKVSLKKNVTKSGKSAPDDLENINLKLLKWPKNNFKTNFIVLTEAFQVNIYIWEQI